MAQWHVHTADGKRLGPLEREELDSWIAQGRLTPQCQVWTEGWPEWKFISEAFPEQLQQFRADSAMDDPLGAPIQPPVSSHPGLNSPGLSSPGRGNPFGGSSVGGQPQASWGATPFASSPFSPSPYAAPAQASYVPGSMTPQADTPGIISMILGIVSLVIFLFGCVFSCFGGMLLYPLVILLAVVGLILGFMAQGNLKVAGITLNALALLPAAGFFIFLLITMAAA